MSAKKKGPAVRSCGTQMNSAACENHHVNLPYSGRAGNNAGGRDVRFAWQKSIRNSDLSKTSRAVLQTLATYMDPEGKCYPSQTTLAADTGTSKRTIVKHIGYAEQAGWLRKVNVKSGRGTWGRNIYYATFPRKIEQGNDAQVYQVNLVHEPGAPNGSDQVHEVHLNNPLNNHFNNGPENRVDELFELVWDNFPRNPKSSAKKAMDEWLLLTAAEQEQCVRAAVEFGLQFKHHQDRDPSPPDDKLQYVPHLSTWLARREWAR